MWTCECSRSGVMLSGCSHLRIEVEGSERRVKEGSHPFVCCSISINRCKRQSKELIGHEK